MAKTARQFSRNEVWKVATKYATSRYSHRDFEEEYQSNRSCFYTVLDRAVIENIVDSDTVSGMEKKAKYNAEAKAGRAGAVRTEKHYSHLRQKRKDYLLSMEETIRITIEYAESSENKKQFCRKNHITEQLLNRTIYKAIVKNWVNDEIVIMLKRKSLSANDSMSTVKFWEQLLAFRER